MITLYHSPQTRSSRIIWLLEELGQPYRIEPVSIVRGMDGTGAPDPKNPDPDKRVPAIDHEGVVVSESVAIALYLADAFPQAELAPRPSSRDRACYLTWLVWYAAEFEPALIDKMMGDVERNPMRQRRYDAAVNRVLKALGAGNYLLGDGFTAADLILSSALAWGRKSLPDSATIDAYIVRCTSRPAAQQGMAKDNASGVQIAA